MLWRFAQFFMAGAESSRPYPRVIANRPPIFFRRASVKFAREFCVLALLVLLVSAALDVPTTKATSQAAYGYTCVSYIPAEWGEFKGGNRQSGLTFRFETGRFASSPICTATPRRCPRWKFVALRQKQTSLSRLIFQIQS
jgi:hypothetical protein